MCVERMRSAALDDYIFAVFISQAWRAACAQGIYKFMPNKLFIMIARRRAGARGPLCFSSPPPPFGRVNPDATLARRGMRA